MKENKKKKASGIFVHVLTPFAVLAAVLGIMILALAKPSDVLKRYKGIVFMDELKTDPEDEKTGLIIRDKEIIEQTGGEYSDTGEIKRPTFGEHYADLSCSAFETTVPVYWGSDVDLFEIGACQSTGSAVFGDNGNSVISAHVNTFFAELDKLKVGDVITVKTEYARFTYTVSEVISFKKKDTKYVKHSNEDTDTRLTLYTCKKEAFGASDERIGVVCRLTEKQFYTGVKEGT